MLAREDMLELTRRMSPGRTSFDRIAGAYMDGEGFIDGTFNTHFLKLSGEEKDEKLKVAKQIPFGQTGVQLKEYFFPKESRKPGGMYQILEALLECGLKNDALLDNIYELIGEQYHAGHDYAIYFYHDRYDIPAKGSDKKWQWESDEMFEYLVCAICPVDRNYKPGKVECGFLYPAYENRAARPGYLAIYQQDPDHPHTELAENILRCRKN